MFKDDFPVCLHPAFDLDLKKKTPQVCFHQELNKFWKMKSSWKNPDYVQPKAIWSILHPFYKPCVKRTGCFRVSGSRGFRQDDKKLA